MSDLPKRSTSVVGFVLLYLAFCISYIDRAAISLALAQMAVIVAATIKADRTRLAPLPD